MKSSTKQYLILAVIVLLGLIIYFYWKGNAPATGALEETNLAEQAVGRRVLGLLAQINQLKIDAKFFDSPLYQSLQDYSVSIQPLPVGRTNPFAPVPGQQTNSTSNNTQGAARR